MKQLIVIFFVVVCCSAQTSFDSALTSIKIRKGEHYILASLERKVTNDLETIKESVSSFTWRFQPLNAFPIQPGGSTLMACCQDYSRYRSLGETSDGAYLLNDSYDILVGVQYKTSDNYPYIYSILLYKIGSLCKDSIYWKFMSETHPQ
jgi:hypothetical protein